MRVRSHHFLRYDADDAARLLVLLLGCEALVGSYVLLHVVVPQPGWWSVFRPLLDVDAESSLPTWFSTVQLAAVSIILLLQSSLASPHRLLQGVLGLTFLFLSADEGAAIHERIWFLARRPVQDLTRSEDDLGFLGWMVPYVTLALLGLAALARPLLHVWRNFRADAVVIALGGAIAVGGGIGLELLSHYRLIIAEDERFLLTVAAEEAFEMAGVTAMLYGFMRLGLKVQAMARDRNRAAEPAA